MFNSDQYYIIFYIILYFKYELIKNGLETNRWARDEEPRAAYGQEQAFAGGDGEEMHANANVALPYMNISSARFALACISLLKSLHLTTI